ncbi:hypothetical protein EV175_005367 [Coemansia sp. RSA 1933]|nr:hypothetical protein EV175_005367 [Coemansia sp. RSA 1933]
MSTNDAPLLPAPFAKGTGRPWAILNSCQSADACHAEILAHLDSGRIFEGVPRTSHGPHALNMFNMMGGTDGDAHHVALAMFGQERAFFERQLINPNTVKASEMQGICEKYQRAQDIAMIRAPSAGANIGNTGNAAPAMPTNARPQAMPTNARPQATAALNPRGFSASSQARMDSSDLSYFVGLISKTTFGEMPGRDASYSHLKNLENVYVKQDPVISAMDPGAQVTLVTRVAAERLGLKIRTQSRPLLKPLWPDPAHRSEGRAHIRLDILGGPQIWENAVVVDIPAPWDVLLGAKTLDRLGIMDAAPAMCRRIN